MEDLHKTLFRRVKEHWEMINSEYVPYFANLYNKGNYWKGDQINRDPDSAINLLRAKIKSGQYYNPTSDPNKKDNYSDYASQLPKLVNKIENARKNAEQTDNGRERDKYYELTFEMMGKYENTILLDYTREHIDFSKYGERKFNYIELRNFENNKFRQEAKEIIKQTNEFNNYYLLLPETYDLILKSDNPYNPQFIKYGLFLAYLEEIFYRERTTPQSRYVFTAEEIINISKHLLRYDYDDDNDDFIPNRRMMASLVYPLPFIPPNSNLIIPPDRINFYSIFLEKNTDLNPLQEYILPDWTAPSGNRIRYHVNGSTLVFKIQKKDLPEGADIDIRIGHVDNEYQISDQDFDDATQHLIDTLNLDNVVRVDFSKEKYKYVAEDTTKNLKYDIFRASFGFVSNYHVPAVRCDLSPGGFLFYPSSVVANLIGYSLDLRMFVNEKINPFEIVKKYVDRGYSFFLNDNEMILWVENIAMTKNIILHTIHRYYGVDPREEIYFFIPFVCYPPFSNPGYEQWIYSAYAEDRGSLDLLQICPPEHKETLMKHIMGIVHNRIISRKKFLCETEQNLPVPSEEDLQRFSQLDDEENGEVSMVLNK